MPCLMSLSDLIFPLKRSIAKIFLFVELSFCSFALVCIKEQYLPAAKVATTVVASIRFNVSIYYEELCVILPIIIQLVF